jgi:AraC family transcriptional regulator
MSSKPSPVPQIQPSRFEDSKPLRIVGLKQHCTADTMKTIPALWQRFIPNFGKVPGQVGHVAYGVCSNFQPNPISFDYLAGVEVSGNQNLPEGFSPADIPALRYAIFPHYENVSAIPKTVDAIFHNWFPTSGHAHIQGKSDLPYMLERYGEKFNPQTGTGDIEIWIPMQP